MKGDRREGRAAGPPRSPLPVLPCACANLRRAARAASQIYDRKLAGEGLNIAQFTLLQALFRLGRVPQRALGELLVLDSTTLTRTLRPLETKGLIRRRPGADRRERLVTLTAPGRALFQRAVPAWNRAQQTLARRIGRVRWKTLMRELSRIADAGD